jgi:Ser/Thr protein kinase RdoA (MazF antagonist)
MDLFLPNNLSRHKPEFVALSDIHLCSNIAELLETCYSLTNFSSLRLSQFAISTVNRNLLVELDTRKFFLKSKSEALEKKRLNVEARIAVELGHAGLRVPRVILTATGEAICERHGASWALYAFEEGTYFRGEGRELDAAAEAFGKVSRAALNLSAAAHRRDDDDGLFLEDIEPLLDWVAKPNARYSGMAALCLEHHHAIIDRLQQVRRHRKFVEATSLPMHLDYHPLNLLMKDEEVACILDFEHLKTYPVAAGVGFAAYKLIRQAMVNVQIRQDEMANPTMVQRWLAGWRASFPQFGLSREELGVGASYRVLRLIHLILDAALKRFDDRFNYDLAKQIGSLYEIDLIFGRG